ncbi:MAG: hypothetical protein P9X24_03965 [Candidatus Hatepunaea meridiana]|nr:hypothetical protein [Candidatus Hatepunaea meridiana]
MNKTHSISVSAVITAVLLVCAFHPVFLFAQFCTPPDRIYHPADSTIYFTTHGIRWWDDDSDFGYVFRLKDEAHRIERSSDLMQERFSPGRKLTHDNISGRLYSGEVDNWIVSENGGDNWREATGPQNIEVGIPGENPEESFRIGIYWDGERYPWELYSTSDSWESWDTSNVTDYWNTVDYSSFFTRRNGCMIRFTRARDRLEFSSDTGRTWIAGAIWMVSLCQGRLQDTPGRVQVTNSIVVFRA